MNTVWEVSRMAAAITAGVVLALSLGLGIRSEETGIGLAAVAMAAPIAADDCVACEDGEDPISSHGCFEGEHDAWDTFPEDEEWTRNGGAHIGEPYCRSGSCDVKHGPACIQVGSPSNETVEQLRVAVQADDAQSIAGIVRAHSGSISVNVRRSAVQIVDCNGAVLWHLPVSEHVATRFAPL